MKRILIFGANSIITPKLADIHSEIGDQVTIAFHSKPNPMLSQEYQQVALTNLINNPIEREIDIVYLLSASLNNNDIAKLCEVNINLIHKITQSYKNSRIIYFSSVAIYDGALSGTIDDSTKIYPESFYGISKYFGEKIVQQNSNFGIIRISSIYGIGMKENTFLPKIINNALDNNNITIFGDGSRTQNYIHVTDVAKLAYKLASSNQNQVILTVHPKNYTNLEIAHIIKKILGCEINKKGEDLTRSVKYKTHNQLVLNHQFVTMEQGIKEWIQNKIKQY